MIKYFKFDGVLFDFIHKCPLKYQDAKPAKYYTCTAFYV